MKNEAVVRAHIMDEGLLKEITRLTFVGPSKHTNKQNKILDFMSLCGVFGGKVLRVDLVTHCGWGLRSLKNH